MSLDQLFCCDAHAVYARKAGWMINCAPTLRAVSETCAPTLNPQVTDIKVVDMLVVKGQMELDEVHHFWKQKTHVVWRFENRWRLLWGQICLFQRL